MNLRTSMRSLLLLLSVTSVTAQPRDADLDRYSDQARVALSAKKWNEAETALEHLAQLAPGVPQVQANLGMALFFEGRAEEALKAFERARKLDATLPQVEVMIGVCDAELGRYQEAIAILTPAFAQPTDDETGRLIGLHLQRSYAELKQFDKADATGEQLLKRYPKDPEILFQVSRLHAERSYQLMKQLMEAAPDSYWVHMANAQVQESLARYDLAQQEYRKAIALNSGGIGAHYGLGRAILNGPRDPHAIDEAAREFERELAISPANATAEFELGEIARERGQLDAARDHFLKAVRYNPDLFEAQIGLARLLLKQGSPRDAVRHLEQAARLDPGDTLPHYLLASAYKSLGDSAGAGRELDVYRKLRASGRPAAAGEQQKEP
jgi:tetratricopeptide (TPR) repeat protein